MRIKALDFTCAAIFSLLCSVMLTGCATQGRAVGQPESPRSPNIVPQDIVEHVRAMGLVVETGVAGLYQKHQSMGDLAGVTKAPNQKYGMDERQFVDVFAPEVRSAKPVPVVVFIHGGAFVGGAASTPGSFQNDNLGKFFARNNVVFVNVEYRLAPAYPWPAAGQDFSAAVNWTRLNIDKFGGDPARIFVMGQSAGGAHAAHYSFDRRTQANGGKDGVIGSILLSPVVSYESIKTAAAYYGSDPKPDMAPLAHVNERKLPVFLGFAQYDPPMFQRDAALLFSALCARDGICPIIKNIQQHSHLSEIFHINTADDSLGSDLLTFVRDVSTR
ncbi:alpha/beta hydrolase [Comamonas composti]|uniref:alpha/beta hydrolase n=1 Tax=Comamonas composti TaxID=408558 RepID=UPI0003F9211F|nr:alpha/beta hydrolase [Comamonas composti]